MPYDSEGERVTAAEVLEGDELADYYRSQADRNHGTSRPNGRRWLRDELGFVSEDGGFSWRYEGEAAG